MGKEGPEMDFLFSCFIFDILFLNLNKSNNQKYDRIKRKRNK